MFEFHIDWRQGGALSRKRPSFKVSSEAKIGMKTISESWQTKFNFKKKFLVPKKCFESIQIVEVKRVCKKVVQVAKTHNV